MSGAEEKKRTQKRKLKRKNQLGRKKTKIMWCPGS